MKLIKKFVKSVVKELYLKYSRKILGDEGFIVKNHKKTHGKKPDLESPKTFNEKIQWRKLNEKNPLFSICSDKYLVREYVKNKIGEEYLIPLYQIVDKWTDIKFEELPNEFVIKTTHDSGGVAIVRNKNKMKATETFKIKNKIKYSLRRNFGRMVKEDWYSEIKPQIIVEKLLLTEDKKIPEDYKLYIFTNQENGQAKVLIQVEVDRFGDHRRGIFDENWNLLNVKRELELPKKLIKKPEKINEMIKISKKLGEDFSFVRVDLYEVNGKIYFGEMTFAPASGNTKFIPESWDLEFGKMWNYFEMLDKK